MIIILPAAWQVDRQTGCWMEWRNACCQCCTGQHP